MLRRGQKISNNHEVADWEKMMLGWREGCVDWRICSRVLKVVERGVDAGINSGDKLQLKLRISKWRMVEFIVDYILAVESYGSLLRRGVLLEIFWV